MARVNIYEADPLTTFIERLNDGDYYDWWDIPDDLVDAYESAEKQLHAAREAVQAHIRDNGLVKHDAQY